MDIFFFSSDISPPNLPTAEKIHIPIKEGVSEPINKIPNFSSFKDVQSLVKNKDEQKEPKRLQCITKAEVSILNSKII